MWNQIDIAWVAGIIEGEGYFSSVNNGTSVRVGVNMTDLDVIEKLQSITGIGTIINKTIVSNRKPAYIWRVSKYKDVSRLMLAIYPLMSSRRQMKIDQMSDILVSHKTRKCVCPNCNIIFFTKHVRKKFCKIECKNQYNALASYYRNREL